MEHKNKLEDLHRESLKSFEEYLKTKNTIEKEDKEKIDKAISDWDVAWNELMKTLLVLERLEI